MENAIVTRPSPLASTEELLVGHSPKKKLNQWLATGICGNDITSSCLYVSAIAAVFAGVLAPVVLLLVVVLLYLYKKVYTEVVEALPLNGGTYNCLLNSTSKFAAALAACMTILSYIATAVISSKTAVEYLHTVYPNVSIIGGTIFVLGFFAALAIIGITESAVVALTIFIFHMSILAVFCILGFVSIPADFHIFKANLSTLPAGENLIIAIALGFSAALLGISGFESSANFVEEQDVGVFRKTLRNMLIAVAIFNPLISVLSLNLFPLEEIVRHKDYLLSEMAHLMGGQTFKVIIVIDAAAVLSGAVLTSFVGVTGLVQRMSLDQCLPQFLLKKNRRGTSHRIIIGFFLLCSSILLVTKGSLLALAGVYTISFLGVMTLFGIGNILLKTRRKELKRTYRAGWLTIIVAVIATSLGMVGNVIIDYKNLLYFLQYFIPTALLVVIMYLRIPILRTILQMLNNLMTRVLLWRTTVIDSIIAITEQRVILFTRGGNLARMHSAFNYIVNNESSRSVVVLHLYNHPEYNEESSLKESLKALGEIFPMLKVELVVRKSKFGPEVVEAVSKEFKVPVNNIFIGAPEEKHAFSIQDLGGVRVIF
ncbi:MAG: APC family permease [Desulfobacterales bacterium]|uniref:APC family permease n=1 Tax=Candidatus Desulfatibia vada TaxID=2841696 RepID=A0A8J6TJG5_9BACT|nr:APC family permease [Candidatus Desulfatibia vada]MBL6970757.1 APC family permease [Desulfobacterales bacterium]